MQTLVLLEGDNFSPEYLKLQPSGTVPALVDLSGEVLDSTTVRPFPRRPPPPARGRRLTSSPRALTPRYVPAREQKVVKYLIANAPSKPASWEPASPEFIEALHACVHPLSAAAVRHR